MTEPTILGQAQGLLKICARLFEIKTSAEFRELTNLTRKKFSELEATHEAFVSIIARFEQDLSTVQASLADDDNTDKMNQSVRAAIDAAECLRDASRERRRAAYAEAKVYSESPFEERQMLKRVPDDVLTALREFMAKYCNYFEDDGRYQHRLGELIASASAAMDLSLRSRLPQSLRERTIDLEAKLLKTIIQKAEDATDLSRQQWAVVADSFYRFDRICREYGAIERSAR